MRTTRQYINEFSDSQLIIRRKADNCIVATVLFDPADLGKIHDYYWTARKDGYIGSRRDGERYLIHRVIMEPARGFVVDHINHDRADNRRSNLRSVTFSVNLHNMKDLPENLNYQWRTGKYNVRFSVENVMQFFGGYKDKDEAEAKAKEIRLLLLKGERPQGIQRKSSSGIVGINYSKEARKWVARVRANGRRIYLGKFATIAEAHQAIIIGGK